MIERFKAEQLRKDAPPPFEDKEKSVSYLGTEVPKGLGGTHVPNLDRFQNDTLTEYDLRLSQKIAVGLSLNQPILIEGGSGIGKSQTVDRMCAELNRESYYANCHDYDAETLIGSQTTHEATKSGFGWKDGVIIQAARNGGLLFLDEYNFMRGDTRGRLHEVLDSILRGKGEIVLTENNSEVVKVHPEFRVVAAQNPPGGSYGDREVLDPAQIDRFVYIKEPDRLDDKTRLSRLLGRLGKDNRIDIPKEEYLAQGEQLSEAEVATIPGIEELLARYVEVSEALRSEVENRTIARGQPQPVAFGTPRDDKRIFEFVQGFYRGDINKTFQDALRYYYANRVIDPTDREKIQELINTVVYVPPQNTRRKGLEQTEGQDAVVPSTAEAGPEGMTIAEAERILGRQNVLGYADVKQIFRVDRTDPIQFSRADLETAKRLGQKLILYTDKMMVEKPGRFGRKGTSEVVDVTLKNMKEKFTKAHDGSPMHYDQDWYNNEEFFKSEKPRVGWHLTSTEVVPNSTSQNYVQQTETLIQHLLKDVYKGKTMPGKFGAAMAEFDKQKTELTRLATSSTTSEWQEGSRRLSELAITKLTRELPVEAMYRLAFNDQARQEKLLPSMYTWTAGRASGGGLVYVGDFDDGGAAVGGRGPGITGDALGVCFSRM